MRKTSLLVLALLAGMMVTNGMAQDVSAVKKDSDQNQQDKVKTIFSFKNELSITDDQELKLKALLYDEQSFFDTDNNSLKSLGAQLSKMIDDKGDMSAIKDKLEAISKVQVELSYRNIEDSRKIEAILTPDQLAKWRDIQKKFNTQGQPKA